MSRSAARQIAHIGLSETVVAVDAIAQLGVIYGPNREWLEKWHNVRQHLERVESDCEPGGYKGNDVVRRDFESFFVECTHLADWLWHDPSTKLSESDVRRYIRTDTALTICAAAANTAKHHTRSNFSAMTARIASVTSNAHGAQVTLDWWKGSDSGTEDALDLARRCCFVGSVLEKQRA